MSAPQPGTPLPWQYRDDYTTGGFVTIIGNVDGEYIDGQAHHTYDVVCRCEDEFGERLPNVGRNVRYIIHACNNYPKAEALAYALRQIAWMRPVGNENTAANTRALVKQMETLALTALAAWEAKP